MQLKADQENRFRGLGLRRKQNRLCCSSSADEPILLDGGSNILLVDGRSFLGRFDDEAQAMNVCSLWHHWMRDRFGCEHRHQLAKQKPHHDASLRSVLYGNDLLRTIYIHYGWSKYGPGNHQETSLGVNDWRLTKLYSITVLTRLCYHLRF
jgi:hypothetical protein